MSNWQEPGTLFARRHSLSRLHFLVAFLFVALCPLALASTRPLETTIVLLVSSRIFYLIGKYFSQSAGIALVGAVGEEDVAAVLQTLPAGWVVERNVPSFGGDIDFLVTSPHNKIYLLEAKAHSGAVVYDGVRLMRRVKGKQIPFEKDILSKIKQQAVQVRTERKLSYVNPLVVFSRADVQVSQAEIAYAKVLSLKELLPFLTQEPTTLETKIVVRTNLMQIGHVVSDQCKGEASDKAREITYH